MCRFYYDGRCYTASTNVERAGKAWYTGKILTTDYQNFSEPRALRKLAELNNITLKMYRTKDAGEDFHTKGYIFKNEEFYRMIVGSSNLTLNALTKNREWNTKVVSTERGEYAADLITEFTELWNSESGC